MSHHALALCPDRHCPSVCMFPCLCVFFTRTNLLLCLSVELDSGDAEERRGLYNSFLTLCMTVAQIVVGECTCLYVGGRGGEEVRYHKRSHRERKPICAREREKNSRVPHSLLPHRSHKRYHHGAHQRKHPPRLVGLRLLCGRHLRSHHVRKRRTIKEDR